MCPSICTSLEISLALFAGIIGNIEYFNSLESEEAYIPVITKAIIQLRNQFLPLSPRAPICTFINATTRKN